MSARKTVIDGIVAALSSSTGINYVTKELEAWWEWSPGNFPGVNLIVGDTETDRICYPTTAGNDMEARMAVEVRGYVKDASGVSLYTKQTDLLAAIEKAIKTSTNATAVTQDVEIDGIDTDRGQLESESICSVRATIVYHYNHLSP